MRHTTSGSNRLVCRFRPQAQRARGEGTDVHVPRIRANCGRGTEARLHLMTPEQNEEHPTEAYRVGTIASSRTWDGLQKQLETVRGLGFASVEFSPGAAQVDCVTVAGVELSAREWDGLAQLLSPFARRTLHGIGPFGSAWVGSTADESDRSLKVFETQVRFAAAVGIEAIVLHDTNTFRMTLEDFLAASRENLKRQAEVAERYGVRAGVENPAYGSLELMREQIEAVNSPCVGFTIDTGHLVSYLGVYGLPERAEGLDQALAMVIEALLPRCVDMHVHDVSLAAGDHLCPGTGSIDWAQWAANIRRIGYEGPIQLEVGTFDSLGQLAAAARRLEELLSGEPSGR